MTTEIWFESAGTRLFAVEDGRGVPVIYCHGGLADHRSTLFRVGALAATHRLIAPDVRAAGRSVYAGELSWELLADDLAALMDHLALDRAVIGGVSAGSGIALHFVRRHPTRVRAVVLAWPVYAGEHGLAPASRTAMARMAEVGRRTLDEGVAALLPLFDALPPAIRDVARAMASRFDPASVAATTRFLASGAEPFERLAELAAIAVPTLVVPGVDPEHPAEVAELYARSIPGATLATTTDVAAAIAKFL